MSCIDEYFWRISFRRSNLVNVFKPFDTLLSSLQHFQKMFVSTTHQVGIGQKYWFFEHLGSCFLNPVCKVLLNYSWKYNIDSIYRCVYMRHSLNILRESIPFSSLPCLCKSFYIPSCQLFSAIWIETLKSQKVLWACITQTKWLFWATFVLLPVYWLVDLMKREISRILTTKNSFIILKYVCLENVQNKE